MFTRMVWSFRLGTSLARTKMRMRPSSSMSKPSGGEVQPMSTCPDNATVSVAAGPPVATGLPFSPSSRMRPSTTLWVDAPLLE